MTRSHGNCGFVLVLVELITPLYPGPLVQVFLFQKRRDYSIGPGGVNCASVCAVRIPSAFSFRFWFTYVLHPGQTPFSPQPHSR